MAQLIPEVIGEILSHCPVKSVLRFKAVSRLWLAITNDPLFISVHLCRSPPSILIHACTCDPDAHVLYSYGSRSVDPAVKLHRILYYAGPDDNGDFPSLEFLGSPNGVVCAVQYPDSRDFTLWNPATRTYLRLPAPTLTFDPEIHMGVCVGLGFDPSGDGDYKIIRLLDRRDKHPDAVEVLSVNLGRWTRLMRHRSKLMLMELHSIVARGVPYWRSARRDSEWERPRERLVWFDVVRDSFRMEDFAWVAELHKTCLGAVNDTLCAMAWDAGINHFDVWVKEGVGRAGWIRKYRRVELAEDVVEVGFYGMEGIVTLEDDSGGNLIMFDPNRRLEVDEVKIEEELHPDEHVRVLGCKYSLTPMPQLGLRRQ